VPYRWTIAEYFPAIGASRETWNEKRTGRVLLKSSDLSTGGDFVVEDVEDVDT